MIEVSNAGAAGVRRGGRAVTGGNAGKEENVRLIYRYGQHHGLDDITTYFDWFDKAFGRKTGYAACVLPFLPLVTLALLPISCSNDHDMM